MSAKKFEKSGKKVDDGRYCECGKRLNPEEEKTGLCSECQSQVEILSSQEDSNGYGL
jgi:hypothetical protein